MRYARFTLAVLLVTLAIPATSSAATKTLKVRGGTTTLTFAAPAAQQLVSMGIGFASLAPAAVTPTGAVAFPIATGKLKVTAGRHPKTVTGTVALRGGMSLSNPVVSIALNKPSAVLAGKRSVLDATSSIGGSPPLPIQMATLDLSKAKATVTSKRVTLAGVRLKLTKTAAVSMNGAFSVTGFTPGFEIGTVALQAEVKR